MNIQKNILPLQQHNAAGPLSEYARSNSPVLENHWSILAQYCSGRIFEIIWMVRLDSFKMDFLWSSCIFHDIYT